MRISKQAVGIVAVGLCVVGSIASHLRIDERYPWRLVTPSFYTLSENDRAAWTAIGLIPKDASVAAQAAFPQLSSRKEIYNLPIDTDRFKPDYLVASVNYDMWPFGGPSGLRAYIQSAQTKHGYKIIYNESGTTVLKLQ